MKNILLFTFISLSFFVSSSQSEEMRNIKNTSISASKILTLNSTIHHEISVNFRPENHEINLTDIIDLTSIQSDEWFFYLDEGLTAEVPQSENYTVQAFSNSENGNLKKWIIKKNGNQKIKIFLKGSISHPPVNDESIGDISTDGISLMPGTGWYPTSINENETFHLSIQAPKGWSALSQGQFLGQTDQIFEFEDLTPQKGIYLISAPFTVTTQKYKNLTLNIYLRSPSKEISDRFLSYLPSYFEQFEKLYGAYAYNTFSVVENYWETGFGMPAFTLLGPNVIKLPFLVTSSLPHEVLHNWWGNGVYVDYEKGNWCEGLTTYGADHWQQELTGKASTYRRDALGNYKDFAAQGNDFPLIQFKGRHNSSSQAVGYGKTMMLFHMLRVQFGDDLFFKSLSHFYKNNLFKLASYKDIQNSFEAVTGTSLQLYFNQWTLQAGAPTLKINSAIWSDGVLKIILLQNSSSPIYPIYNLNVPIKIEFTNRTEKTFLKFNLAQQVFEIPSIEKPLSVSIDPDFDIFRMIFNEERPFTMSGFYGQPDFSIYSSNNSTEVAEVFSSVFNSKFVVDNNLKQPVNAKLIVGFNSDIKQFLTEALKEEILLYDDKLILDSKEYNFKDSVIALSFNYQGKPYYWLNSPENTDNKTFARRLTHYNTFSAVIFQNGTATLKKVWAVKNSPLKKVIN